MLIYILITTENQVFVKIVNMTKDDALITLILKKLFMLTYFIKNR